MITRKELAWEAFELYDFCLLNDQEIEPIGDFDFGGSDSLLRVKISPVDLPDGYDVIHFYVVWDGESPECTSITEVYATLRSSGGDIGFFEHDLRLPRSRIESRKLRERICGPGQDDGLEL